MLASIFMLISLQTSSRFWWNMFKCLKRGLSCVCGWLSFYLTTCSWHTWPKLTVGIAFFPMASLIIHFYLGTIPQKWILIQCETIFPVLGVSFQWQLLRVLAKCVYKWPLSILLLEQLMENVLSVIKKYYPVSVCTSPNSLGLNIWIASELYS